MREKGPHAPTDQETLSPPIQEAPSASRRERFMRSLHEIFGRSEQDDAHKTESEEEDDTAESSPSKPRKHIARFLRNLGLVRRNSNYEVPAETSEETPLTLSTLFSRGSHEDSIQEVSPRSMHTSIESPAEGVATPQPEVLQATDFRIPRVDSAASMPSTSEVATDASAEVPLPPGPNSAERVSTPAMPPAEVLYAQPDQQAANVTHIESRPNNWGPAIATGVVVDQLSRHRDRKIREQAHQTEKQVDQLKKNHKVLEQKQKQKQKIEHQEHHNHSRKFEHQHKEQQKRMERPERVEQPKVATEAFIPLHASREAEVPLRSAEQVPRQERTQEQGEPRLRSVEIPRAEVRSIAEPELRPVIEDAKAELVLQQVETAAEQNIALENQYELRHEVKDVATSRTAQGGALAAGMDGGGKLGSQTMQGVSTQPANTRQPLLPKARNQEEAYKQAMKAGFWTAMAIVIFVLLVAVMFRLQG